ncbi:MAG: tetratricopeptide repeat protein [Bacteroidota bacterium]
MEEKPTKVIFAGQLEFGTSRNFENVQSQYAHRMEHYYKNDILLKPEVIFNPDDHTMDIPRTVVTSTDRQYKNTVNLLERIATFSIAGDLNIWRLNGIGQMMDHRLFEPKADRTTNQLFRKGREMLDQEEHIGEAKELLTQAIDNFERHAVAYERRGVVNYKLGNNKDALYDFTKSIKIYASKPESYYGRGLIYFQEEEDLEKAIADFGSVAKYAIPHQKIYWLAKRMRADALRKAGRLDEARREYAGFVNRKQQLPGLESYDRLASYRLGEIYLSTDKQEEAAKAFQTALEAPEDSRAPKDSEIQAKLAEAKG